VPYLIEPEVNAYGFLCGGDEFLSVDVTTYGWDEPYPIIKRPLAVSWTPGELSTEPRIFHHNLLRDFVVDDGALGVLTSAVDGGFRIYAKLVLESVELSVVQVTETLDVVDIEKSIPSEYSWAEFSFPHISESRYSVTDNKIFRVPNRGFGLWFFVGNAVKQAYDDAGLTGWLFHEARVVPDSWESGTR
jgi:hypothetical protein